MSTQIAVSNPTIDERKAIKNEAKDLGLELTLHATFSDVNIAAYNETIRLFYYLPDSTLLITNSGMPAI